MITATASSAGLRQRVPSRDELRAHLIATGLAGPVATPREENLRSYRQLATGDPRALLGLVPARHWSAGDVLSLMARRCGVSPDPAYTRGRDTIDPELSLAALDAFADRLAQAAADRAPVLVGTGHPARLLGLYTAIASALATAGCAVLTPGAGRRIELATRFGTRSHTLDYVRGVGFVRCAGTQMEGRGSGGRPPEHTHSPLPVRTALSAAVDEGLPMPKLVVGDHGWVCGAGQSGIPSMGPADTNDPALFVGEAEGSVSLAVPIDDAVRPPYYRALESYVLNRAGLSG